MKPRSKFAWRDAVLEQVKSGRWKTSMAVVVYCLAAHMGTRGYNDCRCWPELKTICSLTGLSPRAVRERIRVLKRAGYLEIHRRHRRSSILQAVIPKLSTIRSEVAAPATRDQARVAPVATSLPSEVANDDTSKALNSNDPMPLQPRNSYSGEQSGTESGSDEDVPRGLEQSHGRPVDPLRAITPALRARLEEEARADLPPALRSLPHGTPGAADAVAMLARSKARDHLTRTQASALYEVSGLPEHNGKNGTRQEIRS